MTIDKKILSEIKEKHLTLSDIKAKIYDLNSKSKYDKKHAVISTAATLFSAGFTAYCLSLNDPGAGKYILAAFSALPTVMGPTAIMNNVTDYTSKRKLVKQYQEVVDKGELK